MKIDILCSDGSPLGVTTNSLYGLDNRTGVGGSEYYMLTLCEEFSKLGHEVTLYNNPYEQSVSNFVQRNIGEFDPKENRDILITWRSPNVKSLAAKGKKVWVSCDQYTIGDFAKFAPTQDAIVVISDFHKKYFATTYGINNTTVIDIPIRLDDLDISVDKVKHRCIFTSVPDRGLEQLYMIWKDIIANVPDASLVITSDYRLWGAGSPQNMRHLSKWVTMPNVTFLGAVRREELILQQMYAELLVYPCVYDELFCVSVAEAQCCNVLPITTTVGALATTNMGVTVPGNGNSAHVRKLFVDIVSEYLSDRDKLSKHAASISKQARSRFDPKNIMKQWEDKVFI